MLRKIVHILFVFTLTVLFVFAQETESTKSDTSKVTSTQKSAIAKLANSPANTIKNVMSNPEIVKILDTLPMLPYFSDASQLSNKEKLIAGSRYPSERENDGSISAKEMEQAVKALFGKSVNVKPESFSLYGDDDYPNFIFNKGKYEIIGTGLVGVEYRIVKANTKVNITTLEVECIIFDESGFSVTPFTKKYCNKECAAEHDEDSTNGGKCEHKFIAAWKAGKEPNATADIVSILSIKKINEDDKINYILISNEEKEKK